MVMSTKKILIALLFLLAWLITGSVLANQNVLNVYNWSEYMPDIVLKQFEQQTGIHVNYLTYDSDETLYAKLKADPNLGFDVVFPSAHYVKRMVDEHMLRPLDPSQLPNAKYINPLLMNRSFDPHNEYSMPYTWGTTGIVVNKRYHNPKEFNRWSDFWNPKYKNQLLMLDDMREVFGLALFDLGYSFNDRNPEHIKQAYEKLRQLLPNIKLFNSDAEINIYIDEDATIGIGYNGDVHLAQEENPNIVFIYPQGHFPLWIDCGAVPINAPHFNNAMKFLNFIMEPKIAKEIAIYTGYTSPNLAAVKMMPHSWQENKVLNPSKQLLKRAEVESDVGPALKIYEKYWQLLKLGG